VNEKVLRYVHSVVGRGLRAAAGLDDPGWVLDSTTCPSLRSVNVLSPKSSGTNTVPSVAIAGVKLPFPGGVTTAYGQGEPAGERMRAQSGYCDSNGGMASPTSHRKAQWSRQRPSGLVAAERVPGAIAGGVDSSYRSGHPHRLR
jgi:hypothetical protein